MFVGGFVGHGAFERLLGSGYFVPVSFSCCFGQKGVEAIKVEKSFVASRVRGSGLYMCITNNFLIAMQV